MGENLVGKKIKGFSILKLIGEGAFGQVFQGINDVNNKIVAVKAMLQESLNRNSKLKELVRTEVQVLRITKSDNVIAFVDSFESGEYLFIVTEFCNQGDLQEYLKHKKPTEDEAVIFLKQILNGFKGLHEVGAMHRDFKTANVLLNDGVCKIADLGFSKRMEQNSIAQTILGTAVTMAPEVLQEKPYGFSADIWSIGVVFYQMIYQKYPYYGKNDFDLLNKIKNSKPSFENVNISDRAKDFINRCLTVDPNERISWKEIYQHPLITEKEGVLIGKGSLKSEVKIDENANFYKQSFNNNLNHIDIIKSLKDLLPLEPMKVVEAPSFQQLENMEELQKRVKIVKNKEEIIERFDNLYVCKRNDIMFFSKFVQPRLEQIKTIRLNHEVPAFVFAKKSYLSMASFFKSVSKREQVFYGQSGFDFYEKEPNYQKFEARLKEDLSILDRKCKEHLAAVKAKGVTTLEFKQEEDYTVSSSNFDRFYNQTLNEYVRLLAKELREDKADKKQLLYLIEALTYLSSNQKVSSQEFDHRIETAKLEEVEKVIRKKYNVY